MTHAADTPPEPLRAALAGIAAERDEAVARHAACEMARKEAEAERLRLEIEVKLLKEMIRLLRLKQYGPKSEKLTDAQLDLLDLEPGVAAAEIAAEAARPARQRNLRPRPAPAGRQPLPAGLPRVEETVLVPGDQRHCVPCGCPKCSIGFDVTEVLDLKPAELFVRVIRREKLACPRHPDDGVAMPAPAQRIIPGGKLADAFIIEVIVRKYLDHLPLYRQSEALWRDARVDISRSTLCDAVMAAGQLLIPVQAAMRRELLGLDYLQADETPVGVQTRGEKTGQNHRAYEWQYSAPGKAVVFDFQMSRGRAGPAAFLEGYRGVLQTDAYAAYDTGVGEEVIHAGCWSHARRKFFDAHQLDPADGRAREVLERIGRLYAVERQAREQNLGPEARRRLRGEKSADEVRQLKSRLITIRQEVLPGSQMGKACDHALRIWERLEVFLAHGRVELDTNLAENEMRPVALGRKNWLHIGDEQAGPKIAAILSVLATCRRLGIPPRDYLLDVLPRLGRTSITSVPRLTPHAWLQSRQSLPSPA